MQIFDTPIRVPARRHRLLAGSAVLALLAWPAAAQVGADGAAGVVALPVLDVDGQAGPARGFVRRRA